MPNELPSIGPKQDKEILKTLASGAGYGGGLTLAAVVYFLLMQLFDVAKNDAVQDQKISTTNSTIERIVKTNDRVADAIDELSKNMIKADARLSGIEGNKKR